MGFDLESDSALVDRLHRLGQLLVRVSDALQEEGRIPPAWSELPNEVLRLKTEIQTLRRKLTAVHRVHDELWFRDNQDDEVILRSVLRAALTDS